MRFIWYPHLFKRCGINICLSWANGWMFGTLICSTIMTIIGCHNFSTKCDCLISMMPSWDSACVVTSLVETPCPPYSQQDRIPLCPPPKSAPPAGSEPVPMLALVFMDQRGSRYAEDDAARLTQRHRCFMQPSPALAMLLGMLSRKLSDFQSILHGQKFWLGSFQWLGVPEFLDPLIVVSGPTQNFSTAPLVDFSGPSWTVDVSLPDCLWPEGSVSFNQLWVVDGECCDRGR